MLGTGWGASGSPSGFEGISKRCSLGKLCSSSASPGTQQGFFCKLLPFRGTSESITALGELLREAAYPESHAWSLLSKGSVGIPCKGCVMGKVSECGPVMGPPGCQRREYRLSESHVLADWIPQLALPQGFQAIPEIRRQSLSSACLRKAREGEGRASERWTLKETLLPKHPTKWHWMWVHFKCTLRSHKVKPMTTPTIFVTSRAHHPQKPWSRMIFILCVHTFTTTPPGPYTPSQAVSDEIQHGVPLRFGWCASGSEARVLCGGRTVLIISQDFFPTLPGSDLGISGPSCSYPVSHHTCCWHCFSSLLVALAPLKYFSSA